MDLAKTCISKMVYCAENLHCLSFKFYMQAVFPTDEATQATSVKWSGCERIFSFAELRQLDRPSWAYQIND